jgi:hypothetical protein
MKIPFPQIQGYLDKGSLTPIDPNLWTQGGKAVIAYGNVTQLPIKLNKSAGFFNGTNSCVRIAKTADLDFSGDFDIEMFFNTTTYAADGGGYNREFYSHGDYLDANGLVLYISQTNGAIYVGGNNSNLITGTTNIADGLWHHVRLQRSGTNLRLYLDNIQQGSTATNSTNFNSSADNFIGAFWRTGTIGGYFSGWIKELRISNVARTVAVPTAEYTTDANTVLLMHFDTPATSPLAPAIYFNGIGDYLSVADSDDWDFGTDDFTVEFWMKPEITGGYIIMGRGTNFYILNESSNYVRCIFNNGGIDINLNTTTGYTNNTAKWFHVAIVRRGSTFSGYIDGKLAGTPVTSATAITASADALIIGQYVPLTSTYFKGSMREIRISRSTAGNGGARYTSTFTPSQNGFVADSNTKLYIKGNENNGEYAIARSEAPNFVVTSGSGNVKVLAIGGGGSGGNADYNAPGGGGGGGGGYVYNASYAITPQTYQVSIGKGGTNVEVSSYSHRGTNGGNTVFGTITAFGGGAGGSLSAGKEGLDGGCGGGSGGYGVTAGIGSQGANGAVATSDGGAGGGGATGAGSNTAWQQGGSGGAGTANSITGSSVTYAGGGGGGAYALTGGAGGVGGGGSGGDQDIDGTRGTDGLGGGGGGGGSHIGRGGWGGRGGSGVLIISYPTGSITATGGVITIDGANTVHTFSYPSAYGDTKIKYTEDYRSCIFKDEAGVINLNMESWNAGTSSAPDGWILQAGSVAREGTIKHGGSYSAKLTRSGTDAYLRQDIACDIPKSIGATVTIGAWVYATVANRVRIRNGFGTGSDITYSTYHTGDSTWQYLSITFTIPANAIIVAMYGNIMDGDTDGYFDDFSMSGLTFENRNKPYVVGSTKVDFFAIGNGVGYFDGTGDGLKIEDSPDWDFGTGPITYELYARYRVIGGVQYFIGRNHGANQDLVDFMQSTTNFQVVSVGSYLTYAGFTPVVNTWYHFVFVRETTAANKSYLFINGTLVQTGTISTDVTGYDRPISIGCWMDVSNTPYAATEFNGLLDNVRISKGIARYTDTFNPPSVEPTTDAYDKLLLQFNGTTNNFLDTSPVQVTSPSQDTITAEGIRQLTKVKYTDKSGDLFTNTIVSTYSLISTTSCYGGVLDAYGNVHFVPWAIGGVVQMVSAAGIVTTYTLLNTAASQHLSAALNPLGEVHFIPYSGIVGQKLSAAGVVSTYPLIYTAAAAYFGGVADLSGTIHFVPCNASVGQKIYTNGNVMTYALAYTTAGAYAGGVLAPNGDIYFIPLNASVGQKVSKDGVVSTYAVVSITNGFVGGAINSNGEIHFAPYISGFGQKVNTFTGVVSTYSIINTVTGGAIGGVLAPNGDIHFIPYQSTVGQKVSLSGVVSTYSIPSGGYLGGVLNSNGEIHCANNNAGRGMKILTLAGTPLSGAMVTSPKINKGI